MEHVQNLTENPQEQAYLLETLLKYLSPIQVRCTLTYEIGLLDQEIDWIVREGGAWLSCGRIRTTANATPDAAEHLREVVNKKNMLKSFLNKLNTERTETTNG